MQDPRLPRPAKVILLGNSSVGKTSIVLQFHKAQFETLGEPTIGASYVTKVMTTSRGGIPLHVWDTAGQERFKSVIPMYMRGCSVAVLVCAVDSGDSLEALREWIALVRDTVENIPLIYVVVNKMDINSEFDTREIEKWAQEEGCKFFKTSAKEKTSIDPLFEDIAESVAHVIISPPVSGLEVSYGKTCCW